MCHGACQGCTPGGKVECMLTKKDRTHQSPPQPLIHFIPGGITRPCRVQLTTELSMMLTEKTKSRLHRPSKGLTNRIIQLEHFGDIIHVTRPSICQNCPFWSLSARDRPTRSPSRRCTSTLPLALVPLSNLREPGFLYRSLTYMSLIELLGFLTALLLFLWRDLSVLNSAWFRKRTRQRTLDEDASLFQLADAFARKLSQERPLIAERINHPETIRDVSWSWLHF